MNIAIVSESKMSLGGGWSFIGNLIKGLSKTDHTIVDWKAADIVLIPSSSMITKELFRGMKAAGKKVVLRIDNIPRNSRNRNTGTSRLDMMAKEADAVVYQSEWAKRYVGGWLGVDGVIINNSVDEEIFNTNGVGMHFTGNPTYLYSRFNRDETKHWEVAWYEYQMVHRLNKNAKLIIVGQFASEHLEYNFDFYNNEQVEYLGVIESPEAMASILKGCDYLLATYYNDAFSNTYIEALMCGLELYKPDMSGGTPEILQKWERYGKEHFYLERMIKDYTDLFMELVIG